MTNVTTRSLVERLTMLAKVIEHLPLRERDAVEPAFLFLLADLARHDVIPSHAAVTIAGISTSLPIIQSVKSGPESIE